jgi:hypothetical protein|tara:strand:- start:11012 stop:11227 length:216 start_codon:yes stop_codon:yes gene_type:complete
MSIKLLKKLKDGEEKLMDAIYEIQELLDSIEDPELSSMGNSFSEISLDFIQDNDIVNLNDIRNFIEDDLEA